MRNIAENKKAYEKPKFQVIELDDSVILLSGADSGPGGSEPWAKKHPLDDLEP